VISNISFLTYSVAVLAHGLLFVLLLTQWRVRPLGPGLLFAAGATTVWAAVIAVGTLYEYPPVLAIQLSELARNGGWLFFLLQLLGFQEDGDTRHWLGRRWIGPFTAAGVAALVILALRPFAALLRLGEGVGDYALMLWLSTAIAGLLLVEQVYRNASSTERWGIKFLCLGLGSLFAYDFFMYAEALLFRALDAQLWQARGVVAAFVVPWLLVAIARNSNWRMDVHVSRQVVFHTVTLMGAGAYLLAMALIGYFIKYLGGSWGGVIQIGFLAASGALLFTLLFSGALRARLRVLLSKHFFSYRYDYREEWLRFTEGLAALRDVPTGIVSTMAQIALSPGGLLLRRDSSGALRDIAAWELDVPPIEDVDDLAAWLRRTGWVIDLREWRRSPDLYEGLSMPHWLRTHEGLWLVVPLVFEDDIEGILLLARTDLKTSVNWEDRDLLKTAGRQAAALLAQDRASAALVEARQFDAFNRLSAYVIHDLKNILAQQSLMVSNARKHRDNPAFVDDMITTVENSVGRMQRLMEQMRSGLRDAEASAIDLGALLERVVEARVNARPLPALTVAAHAEVIADAERLGTVFGHIIQNAQEATDSAGSVSVRLDGDDARATVEVRDSGCGMSAEFIRDRLFKPFESTKGLTGMGIGVFESREYVRRLGGDIHVESTPGEGSRFCISLPRAAAKPLAMPEEAVGQASRTATPGSFGDGLVSQH